jgi:undecaprenyl-phosphate 4-deoxy-4-formamido-L-arabinose transferase
MAGILISVPAVMFAAVLLGHRLIYGPQEEGALWTVSSLEFFLFGLIFLALGLMGEYIGRIYLEVRRRPTYVVRAVHGDDDDSKNPESE